MLRDTPTERDPPVRAEVVHESARTRVTRLALPDGTVIRKEPLGRDAGRRLEHEVAMLERLHGIAGIGQLLSAPRYAGSLVLEDAGRTNLVARAKPLAVDDLMPIAVALARAVAQMHQRGVMHRDITPANVVLSADGVPRLVDFALASPLGEIRPQFTAAGDIAGNLSYLAPEQTGRIARSVDQRADLYALGATLYELATGAPPFGFADPLRLAHDLLARVPVGPAERNPAVPKLFSEIVLHLLEKEPDSRYQTAEGLVFDLERLLDARPARAAAPVRIGTHDVPLRLLACPRLVARDDEVAALHAAFGDMLAGGCRGVLISGAAGTGKTALADELRHLVTDSDGWFVAGKFDQYRRDLEFDGLFQALRAAGRMLLAEPEDQLAEARERILDAVGPNAGQLAATVPEFVALLGVPPEPGDPLTAQVRMQRAVVATLRALASRRRPVVLFVDDFHWAGRPALGAVDLLLNDPQVEGLLLVAAYREDDPDAAPPVAAALSRWPEQPGVRQLRLVNLSRSGSCAMVAETLRTHPGPAAGLVELIEPYTSGNPHETLELLNALRREGVVTATPGGWVWDQQAAPARLSRSDAARLLTARIDTLPPASQQLVEAMACLAGRVDLAVLEAAIGEPAGALEHRLAPAVEDGVLVMEPGTDEAVRFRHDRIRDVVLRGMDAGNRRALQLSLARRLAAVPELAAVAAEQYLPVVDEVGDPGERAMVVGLLRRAADQAALTGDHALVEALLAAGLRLVDPHETATLLELRTRRQGALYGLGRLEDADEEYGAIERLSPPPALHAEATALQVRSLTHRMQLPEALDLGLEALRQLGIDVPPPDQVEDSLDDQFRHLRQWLERTRLEEDLTRPELTDPTLIGASHLINGLQSPAYFVGNRALAAWLGLEALRIWLDHGPGRSLIGPASTGPFNAVVQRGDHAGYGGLRRLLAVGEARGWEPGTSQARYLYSLLACWVEPLAEASRIGQRAREGLIAGGDLSNAAYTFFETTAHLFDCAPLDACLAEVDAGIAFARRTGNDQTSDWLEGKRWLVGVLRGERDATPALPADRYAGNPLARLNAALPRAIAAAIFGDFEALARHSAVVMPLLEGIEGTYTTAVIRALRGLAVAEQVRAAAPEERTNGLSELDELTRWLTERARHAPENFLPAVRWLEAERAWAVGDFHAAVVAFDAARREVTSRRLPRQRALITERAARFLLAHGVEQGGHELLAQARADYLAWGAAAKVQQLDSAYPSLRPAARVSARSVGETAEHRTGVTTGTVDLLGILSASQALSSETSVARLHSRLVEAVRSLTGATDVHLVLWSEERRDWLPLGRHDAAPLSVLRYARRTGEPVVVADAANDDRFARDPYFAGTSCRSLLAVPIISRGTFRAVLVLENRLIRGAFSPERLDTVKLLAGQLAVSLDNAELYARYRLIADEQAALRRVATLVARAVAPEVVIAAVAEEAGALFGADGTAIVRLEPGGAAIVMGGHGFEGEPGARVEPDAHSLTAAVHASGRADRRDAEGCSEALPHGIVSAVASPIIVDGRVWGVMSVGSRRDPLPQDTEQRLAQFTELVATAIAMAESRDELAASRARVVTTADEARRRIVRDLHDGAQQRLVGLELWLRAAQATVPPELPDLAADLASAIEEASGAAQEVRDLARGIHPAILAKNGLHAALKTLARRAPIPVELELGAFGRLPEPLEVSGYYIVSEALNNVAKHAQASVATVAVDTEEGMLRISVRDDGVGGADLTRGTGMLGLKDRAEALGGRIELDSAAGKGTTLRAQLPLHS